MGVCCVKDEPDFQLNFPCNTRTNKFDTLTNLQPDKHVKRHSDELLSESLNVVLVSEEGELTERLEGTNRYTNRFSINFEIKEVIDRDYNIYRTKGLNDLSRAEYIHKANEEKNHKTITVIRKISNLEIDTKEVACKDEQQSDTNLIERGRNISTEGINIYEKSNNLAKSQNLNSQRNKKIKSRRNYSGDYNIIFKDRGTKLMEIKARQQFETNALNNLNSDALNKSKEITLRSIKSLKNQKSNKPGKKFKKITDLINNKDKILISRKGTAQSNNSGNMTIVPPSNREYNEFNKNTQRLKEFEKLIKANSIVNTHNNKDFFYSPSFTTTNSVNKHTVSLSKYQYLFSDVENDKRVSSKILTNKLTENTNNNETSLILNKESTEVDREKKKNSMLINNSYYSSLFS